MKSFAYKQKNKRIKSIEWDMAVLYTTTAVFVHVSAERTTKPNKPGFGLRLCFALGCVGAC